MDNQFFHYNPDEDDKLEDTDYRRPRHEKEQEKRKAQEGSPEENQHEG